MKHIDRIAGKGYLPTDEDISPTRISYHNGITEHLFNFDDFSLRLFNLGVNNGVERKWWRVFDDVQVIFSVLALDLYDLYELFEPMGDEVSIKQTQLVKAGYKGTDRNSTFCAQKWKASSILSTTLLFKKRLSSYSL